MTRKEWLATLTDRDYRRVLIACKAKPRLDDLIETETVTRDAALVSKEQQLLAVLDAFGVPYTLPFRPGERDTIIPRIMTALGALTGDTRDAMQDNATLALTLLSALDAAGTLHNDCFAQATYERERRTPQYGPSPAELHGFEPYRDVFEVQADLAEL